MGSRTQPKVQYIETVCASGKGRGEREEKGGRRVEQDDTSTDGVWGALCTLGFRRAVDGSRDSQSFRDCRVDRVPSCAASRHPLLLVNVATDAARTTASTSRATPELRAPLFLLSQPTFPPYQHLLVLLSSDSAYVQKRTPQSHSRVPSLLASRNVGTTFHTVRKEYKERVMGTKATVILLLAVIQAAMCNVSPDPRIFFPEIEGNLTKIVWAHAVNSRAELDRALESADIMMLEADVVVGKLNGSTNATDIPIMAHPPAEQSDLSLEDFLNTVVAKNASKGIKLDFKSIKAFQLSKPILKNARKELTFPVLINADILPGPVNATTDAVDAKEFLAGAKEVLPESTLSVGWTTRYGQKVNITEGRYSEEQVMKMIDTLKQEQVKQPITYPVRAGLAANDINSVKKLMEESASLGNATLTIWSSEGDHVNVAELSKLVRDIGVDKVYVDVPEELMKSLNFSAASSLSATLLISLGPILVTMLLSRML